MPAVTYQRTRLLMLMFCALLLAGACGKEAPPRAARITPTPRDFEPAATAGAARLALPIADRRTLGDPKAPISVVEYGDYQ